MSGRIEATGAEDTTFGLHFLLPIVVRVLLDLNQQIGPKLENKTEFCKKQIFSCSVSAHLVCGQAAFAYIFSISW